MEDLQDKRTEEKIKMLTVLSNYLFSGHEPQLTMAMSFAFIGVPRMHKGR